MFLQLLRKPRVDTRHHKLALAARQRLLELAVQKTVRNGHLGDLLLLQQLHELAVGDRGGALGSAVKVVGRLKQEDADDRCQPITDVKTCLLAHGDQASSEDFSLEPENASTRERFNLRTLQSENAWAVGQGPRTIRENLGKGDRGLAQPSVSVGR